MEKQYKTFKDLVFKNWIKSEWERKQAERFGLFRDHLDARQAVLKFQNGYTISVLLGACFYSDGINTYEVAAIKGNGLYYGPPFDGDVLGYQTEEQVTEVMKQVQDLKANEEQ